MPDEAIGAGAATEPVRSKFGDRDGGTGRR